MSRGSQDRDVPLMHMKVAKCRGMSCPKLAVRAVRVLYFSEFFNSTRYILPRIKLVMHVLVPFDRETRQAFLTSSSHVPKPEGARHSEFPNVGGNMALIGLTYIHEPWFHH